MAFSRAQISIFCVLGASVSISTSDVIVRTLSPDYPLHQIVFVRTLVALALTFLIIVPAEGGMSILRTRRPVAHLVRSLCLVIANVTFFAAIVVMPLADATAIFFVAPFLITGMSALFLGEQVGIRRWAALLVGGIGVLLIVQPGGQGFHWAMLLPMLAAVAYATMQTLTRDMGLSENASTMVVFVQGTFAVASILAGLAFGDGRFAGSGNPALEFIFRPWASYTMPDLLLNCAGGVFITAAAYLLSQAYRLSEAGLVAPFEYVILVLAVFWGMGLWGEMPTLLSGGGIILILGAGIFVALREARVGTMRRTWRISGRR
ncbi:MAG: DMT family transporter [Rhodobacteraceae bacterium]|nr:DMT family transporter [Paracoccaceae bacterium]